MPTRLNHLATLILATMNATHPDQWATAMRKVDAVLDCFTEEEHSKAALQARTSFMYETSNL